MAWNETCKIDASKQVKHLKDKGMSARQAIKKLSKESDIPESTIDKWVYPRKSNAKNGVTSKNEAKNKKQPSQEEIWRNAGIKLKRLNTYLEKNCNVIMRNKCIINMKKNRNCHKDVSNGVMEAVYCEITRIRMLYERGMAAEIIIDRN